ncbi:MAG TPA: LAGLIDADG family homing endonuclease [Pseudoneobacillus sp.]|nr:LAGLIDADG family homing endonuclease [Pseudoneobacillus sp.]
MPWKIPIEKHDEIVEKYLSGCSMYTIADQYNSNATSIMRILKLKGVQARTNKINSKKDNYNESYFENIDTEDKAYWLGFLYADGYIVGKQKHSSRKMGISLCIDDLSHLKKFKTGLQSSAKIGIYKASNGAYSSNQYCRILLTGEKICSDLEKHGVVENKTLILQPPTLDPLLVPHFIRGYIDGDGCITSSLQKGKNTPSFKVKIVGTDSVLNYIKEYIEQNNIASIKKLYKRRPTDIVSQLELGGNRQVKAFLDLIYKDATVYLDRKFEKYNKLSNIIVELDGNIKC